MTGIVGVEGLSEADVRQQVQMGARFVMFRWSVSVIIMSFRRTSPIYFVRPGEQPRGWTYTLLTLLIGWWGIPWGPIFTIQTLITNLGGGIDVTEAVLASTTAGESGSARMPDRVGGTVRCGACGYMNGPSRQSCKQCRQSLSGSTSPA